MLTALDLFFKAYEQKGKWVGYCGEANAVCGRNLMGGMMRLYCYDEGGFLVGDGCLGIDE